MGRLCRVWYHSVDVTGIVGDDRSEIFFVPVTWCSKLVDAEYHFVFFKSH